MNNSSQAHKQAAVDYLQLIIAGKIDEAYARYVDMQGKHHNPFFAAGFPALKQAMIENQVQLPHKQIAIKNVLGDGDMVTVHSHIMPSPGGTGMAAVHLFRFRGDKIVEMWDVGQPVPADSPNSDGAF
jgi:predicted SnoaL-like aldol condensation-catalyzing enzyme